MMIGGHYLLYSFVVFFIVQGYIHLLERIALWSGGQQATWSTCNSYQKTIGEHKITGYVP